MKLFKVNMFLALIGILFCSSSCSIKANEDVKENKTPKNGVSDKSDDEYKYFSKMKSINPQNLPNEIKNYLQSYTDVSFFDEAYKIDLNEDGVFEWILTEAGGTCGFSIDILSYEQTNQIKNIGGDGCLKGTDLRIGKERTNAYYNIEIISDQVNAILHFEGDRYSSVEVKSVFRNDTYMEMDDEIGLEQYENNSNQIQHQDQNERNRQLKPPVGYVHIPPGTFTMGSPEIENGRGSDEKKHRVTISKGFYMKATEVTQGEWEEVMGSNPSHFKNCGRDCPVEQVSWDDVQEFIRKYNEKHGGGYRLPTEAEWEYAARAGSNKAFHTGDITDMGCNDPVMGRAGWYCGNNGVSYSGCYDASSWGGPKCAGTHPVGKKEANAWGLYDMHGNVWEWVQDWYGDYPSGAVTDPTGPSSGSARVIRGGSWSHNARHCRAACRHWGGPGDRNGFLGFRLARTLP